MAHTSADLFTPEFLRYLRHFGDPVADAAVAEYMAHLELDVDGDGIIDLGRRQTNVLRTMLSTPVGDERNGDRVMAFLAEPVHLPEWAEPERIERAQALFREYAPQFGLGLWLASIPSGYAGARDASVLWESVRCVSQPKARFFETAQFLVDVTAANGLFAHDDPQLADGDAPLASGVGARDIRHVRLVHALARHLVTHDELTQPGYAWNPEFGVPVNQMALMATMFTFCVVGLQAIEQLGIRLTDDDREHYTHLWNVVGHLLGIHPDLLPLDHAASVEVWNRIKANEYAPSEEGTQLTAAAIEALQTLIPVRWFKGFPATGMRSLIGTPTADMLQVPKADWTRGALAVGRGMNRLFSRWNRDVPGARRLSDWMGGTFFRELVRDENARAGDRTTFELTDELRTRVQLTRGMRRPHP